MKPWRDMPPQFFLEALLGFSLTCLMAGIVTLSSTGTSFVYGGL